ncbi:flagellar export chaperone FlgN [Aeromonas cavernicola]|uniref:Flagellar protein FlgN n=1 Tax=Aeromonas cavernicola TaxID=1006623 RepID=A0A2H9U876_9GAMM|nr:flagellar export chaperone FlgN [Aeromonas cavernicola]PJG60247.1 flagellar protein FlgN [Aeromonas cavernicola]
MIREISLLQSLDDKLNDMQRILQKEFDLLKGRECLIFSELVEQKQLLMSAISSIDKKISEQPNLLEQLSNDHVLLDNLRGKLDCCRAQNEINGHLLELNIVANRRLTVFLNSIRDPSSLTYDAKGNTRSGTRSSGIEV